MDLTDPLSAKTSNKNSILILSFLIVLKFDWRVSQILKWYDFNMVFKGAYLQIWVNASGKSTKLTNKTKTTLYIHY